MTDTKQPVAVVTGAGSGIGRALAQLLDREGHHLAICDVNEVGLHETAKSLTHASIARVVDVSKREQVEALAATVAQEFGRVDLVVNNAGVTVSDSLTTVSYEDFEWLFGINFWGVVFGTKSFLPVMLKQRSGVIVNVSSVFGIIAWPHQGVYNASKFAVRGFTEALWRDLDGTGVRAVSVHPGGIKTNIAKTARFRSAPAGVRDHAHLANLFERTARTTPDEAARVIFDGVKKGKRRVLIGADAKLLALLQRLSPEGYPDLIKWGERRVL